MRISRLALDHFRSWRQVVVDLGPGINILQGANGLGKTNIVEALEVLSTGSSHRVSSSLPLVERGEKKATVRANVVRDDTGGDPRPDATTYEISITARGANRGRINSGRSLYMRDIVGQVPSVSFTPEDQRLISGDPAVRRGFLDQAGALFSTAYATHLHAFTKIARQRVALLKQLGAGEGNANASQAAMSGLEVWTGQFIEEGLALTDLRSRLVDRLAESFSRIYGELAGGSGQGAQSDGSPAQSSAGLAGLRYVPSFSELMESDAPAAAISRHFQRLYPGEVARGRNLIGPHRDDLEFTLDGSPAREFASNGEMWTMALALKMALYGQIAEERGTRPIVILDDVFAQLDETRRAEILDFAARQDQVLITVAADSDIPQVAHRQTDCTIIDVAALKRRADEVQVPMALAAGAPGGPDASATSDSVGPDSGASDSLTGLADSAADHEDGGETA